MDRNDRRAIESLFDRLAAVERQTPHRDPEADAYVREQTAALPGSPYYMAQTIVAQEHALEAAAAKIEELEARSGRTVVRGGGFGVTPQPAPGFLAGAAQTAVGVAGGVLIGAAIADMLGVGAAEATELEPDIAPDDGGFDDGGFDGGLDI